MLKYLPGVTHALVTVQQETDAQQTGVVAVVDLCFGQGDTSISGIKYVKSEGRMSWQGPMIQVLRNGAWIYLPVFKGELLNEICKLAGRAIRRVKQEFGKPAWGKQYQVYTDRVVLYERKEI